MTYRRLQLNATSELIKYADELHRSANANIPTFLDGGSIVDENGNTTYTLIPNPAAQGGIPPSLDLYFRQLRDWRDRSANSTLIFGNSDLENSLK